MAIAFDAGSESHTGTTGSVSQSSFSWTHTPVGTPKGVLVFVFVTGSTSDIVGSVTYGGTALTAVVGGRAVDTAAETGSCKAYFLGASVPTGAQTVVVNRTNTTNTVYAVCCSVTAANAVTETTGVILLQEDGSLTQQSVDDGSPGVNSLRFAGAYYGGAAVPVTGANSTTVHGIDFGNFTAGVVRETTAGQGARPVGFTDASDDRAAVHLAIRERVHSVTPTGVTSSPVVETPALTQNHALVEAGVTSAPAVGTPAITQNHVLAASGVAAGAPVVGTPSVSEQYAVTPTGTATDAPTVGGPALTQNHVTAPSGLTSSPVVGAPALAQDHALVPSGVAAGAPSVGAPALTQDHALAPAGAAAGAPVLGASALSQDHYIAVAALIAGAPVVGSPAVDVPAGQLNPVGVATAPAVGRPSIRSFVPDRLSAGRSSVNGPTVQRDGITGAVRRAIQKVTVQR